MKQNYLLFTLFTLAAGTLQAQQPIPLSEVEVSDTQLKRFSQTQQTVTIADSTIAKNPANLTSLLSLNTTVYFKENGAGMVSSPSFRGTTAQQTAVLWNGININSQFNGQTDFNTINTRSFDEIEVRNGGGSVLFGSGAIGGSIHLNNLIKFNNGFTNSLVARYGSFNTLDAGYKGSYTTKKLSLNIGLSRLSSDNDYDYVDSDRHNINGQYYNNTLAFNAGYKINEKNILKLYSYLYDGDRHFSLVLPTEAKTKYKDFNTRTMLEWDGFYGKFISKVKVAAITERYRYYQNIATNNYTYGEANSVIGKYDLAYNISPSILLNGVVDVNHTTGKGSSIAENSRTITAFNLMLKHNLSNKFLYEAAVRKEVTNNYESPVLFSLGTSYKITPNYSVRLNGSRNYRIPTYNDLYWAGSGNPDLKPESSYQTELGNSLKFKNLDVAVTGFYNNIKNMIVWQPTSNLWMPVNKTHIKTYGLETFVTYTKRLNQHTLMLKGNYAYTVSKDTETDKQLIYVPYHKATAALLYAFKKWSATYQYRYVGQVYLLADNNANYVLDGYSVSNLLVDYTFGKSSQYMVGGVVNNIWNKGYQNVANRYMPGVNYNFYFKLNF